jgi:hypothetical protein
MGRGAEAIFGLKGKRQKLKGKSSENLQPVTLKLQPATYSGYERAKQDVKHLKTKSMENISIKVHPPWYARGTPIINPRDGPQMAENNKLLFAICSGPSARGNPVEVRSLESGVGSQNHDFNRMEDQSRGNPVGKNRLWLTLKTTFFNTKNSVYGQWYAQTRRVETIIADGNHRIPLGLKAKF